MVRCQVCGHDNPETKDRKSTRLNSSHLGISYAVFCLKKKKTIQRLASRRVPDTALQHRHSSQLRQGAIDPQSYAVLTSCIPTSPLLVDVKRHLAILID